MDKLDAMTEQVRDFCDARDWRNYHTPKELAIGMATESSELLQLFRFMSNNRIAEMFEDTEQRQAIEDEVADTLLFLLRFADLNGIDLPAALSSKLKRNGERYPVGASADEYRKADHHEKRVRPSTIHASPPPALRDKRIAAGLWHTKARIPP